MMMTGIRMINEDKIKEAHEKWLAYFKEGNYDDAIPLLKFACKHGHIKSQYCLGNLLYSGFRIGQDIGKGLSMIKDAAEKGNADAQYWMAEHLESEVQGYIMNCIFNGDYVQRLAENSFKWFTEAANQGHLGAQYNFGDSYRYGGPITGLKPKKAFTWYHKAAKGGCGYAYYELSVMYRDGIGVKENIKKSDYWQKRYDDWRLK